MRQYFLLILLTIFSIQQFLYGACCSVTLKQGFLGLGNPPENIAFFNDGNCIAIQNSNGTITSFDISNCTLSLIEGVISSPNVTNIAVSSTGCVATPNFNQIVS